jgi:hypothetical protein
MATQLATSLPDCHLYVYQPSLAVLSSKIAQCSLRELMLCHEGETNEVYMLKVVIQ